MIDNADVSALEILDVSGHYDLTDEVAEFDIAVGEPEASRSGLAQRLGERGMVTAEWAIGIITAVSIAGIVLFVLVKGPFRNVLGQLILNIIKKVSEQGLQ